MACSMSSHAVAILALALVQIDPTLSCCMFKRLLGLCLLHEYGAAVAENSAQCVPAAELHRVLSKESRHMVHLAGRSSHLTADWPWSTGAGFTGRGLVCDRLFHSARQHGGSWVTPGL